MEREIGTRQRPTWAVVIPAHDDAARIGAALRSLRDQSEPADRIVVVDDGSQDDLVAAVAPFRDLVTLVRQRNRGPSAARNTGARHVGASEWILFLDADDWVAPNFLEALRDAAAADPGVDLWVTDALGVDEGDGRVLYRQYERARFVADDQRTAMVTTNFMMTGVSLRREPWEAAGRFDESLWRCEDWECWMRMVLRGSRAGLAPATLLYRCERSASLSSSWVGMQRGRVEVLRRASQRPELTEQERAANRVSLRENQRTLARYEGRELLRAWATTPAATNGDRRATSATLRLARQAEMPPKMRALLALGAVSPATAGQVWGRFRDGDDRRRQHPVSERSAGAVADGHTGTHGSADPLTTLLYHDRILTERLRLRPFQLSDAAEVAAYRSDPATAALQSWATPFTLDMAQRWIESLEGDVPGTPGEAFHYAITRRDDGQLVGDCTVHFGDDPRKVEYGITLGPAHRRGGLAIEAGRAVLDHLMIAPGGVHRVEARCHPANRAAVLAMESLGARQEGCGVEAVWLKGAWTDVLVFALLADEWRRSRSGTEPAGVPRPRGPVPSASSP